MKINRITHKRNNFVLDIEDVAMQGHKIIGLVGENGAGKTTLMSILAERIKPNVLFDVDDYNVDALRFIPSDLGLYEALSVYDFIEVVTMHAAKKVEPLALLERLGLQEKQDEKIHRLSEGMKKKLTLITLFTEEYQLLILDEPFNSIDLKYVHELKEQLRELAKTTTILISSHILDTLNDLCDDFIYLENGKVAKQFANTDRSVLERTLFATTAEGGEKRSTTDVYYEDQTSI